MSSKLARLLLFASSYFPLSLVFFFILFTKNLPLGIGILTLGTIGLAGMKIFLAQAQKLGPVQVTVTSFQRKDSEATSYIMTYVVPFLAVGFNGWEQGIALAIFFLMLSVLYINSNLIHINPMLNLGNHHIYEVTLDDGSIVSLIANKPLRRGETLRVIDIAENIYLEKK